MRSLFVLHLLIVCSWAHAQDHMIRSSATELSPKKLVSKIEFLLGPSYIRPHGVESFNSTQDFKLGVSAGVGLIHQLSSRFDLNLKFFYEDKGYRLETVAINSDYNPPATQRSVIDITFNYATASISPRFLVDKNQHFYLSAGPYVGYLFSERIQNEIYINEVLISKTGSRGVSPYYDYKKVDVGLTTMIGYDININRRLAGTFQFLYNLGLIEVTKGTIAPMSNTTYSLLLGITINRNYLSKL